MANPMPGDCTRRMAVCAAALCLAVALSASALGAAALGAAAQDAPSALKLYRYASDGFAASFPSEPRMQTKNIPIEKGSVELRSYRAEADPAAIFVGVCDYGASIAGREPDSVLEGAKNAALANSGSHLVSETKLTLGIYPGAGYEAESGAAHFSARLYLVGTTLYQTLVVYPLGKPYAESTRFLDSFQLIARTRN